jgi:hypothetical protein
VDDIVSRAQLLKHFSEILGTKIEPLDFGQKNYEVDDSEQPSNAKNIPQKHARHLTTGTADFPSDFKLGCPQSDTPEKNLIGITRD